MIKNEYFSCLSNTTYYHRLLFSRGLYSLFTGAILFFLSSGCVKFITVTLVFLLFLSRRSAYKIVALLENAVRAVAIARNDICVYDVHRGTQVLTIINAWINSTSNTFDTSRSRDGPTGEQLTQSRNGYDWVMWVKANGRPQSFNRQFSRSTATQTRLYLSQYIIDV